MSGRQGFITNHETFVYQEAPTTASAAFGIDSQDSEKWKLIVQPVDGAIPTGTCQFEIDPRTDGDITVTPNGDGFLISAKDFAVMTGDVVFIPLSSTATQGILKIDSTGYLSTLDDSDTDGQVLISANGSAPAWASLTAGSNITITPGANSIEIAAAGAAGITTIAGDSGTATGATVNIYGGTNVTTSAAGDTLTINSSGRLSWSVISSDQSADVNNGYICDKAGTLLLTLPATAAVGDVIRVTGINFATGWKIAQNAGQTIHFGVSDTTTGAGGYLQSTAIRDSVELVCVVADTDFNVISSVGNITVV